MLENWQEGGFGIYVHWPFCEAKCPYCDFNSHVSRSIDHSAWRAAYLEELTKAASQTPDHRVRSIFFGGGTPSLMRPNVVSDIIDAVQRLWRLENDVEITLEANPSSVEARSFAAFRHAGVNRVSIGIQAFNDPDLKRLGRLHSTQEATTALDIAKSTFQRVSFDLIYARQHQSISNWEAELRYALELATDNVSLYQLTVEQGTAFGDRFNAGSLSGLPDEDLSADMYALTQEVCAAEGFPRYEISNHARPGFESKHNKIYWTSGDWVGVGPGAHGRLGSGKNRIATEQISSPQQWLTKSRNIENTNLSAEEQGNEYLLMGLRTVDGVDLGRFNRMAGRPIKNSAIRELVAQGLAKQVDGKLIVTDQGFSVLNYVTAQLISD